ncbi:MAG: hypothetical protein M1457_04555 [bacterium]|nr:hypothetical protein [bacterium]
MGRRRPRFGSGEIIILIVILILVLIFVTNKHREILDMLFGPSTALVAVVMIVEYLLLRGADRSEIYRRELEAAREKRRDDLLALRAMEVELVELRARLNAASRAVSPRLPSAPPGESAPPSAQPSVPGGPSAEESDAEREACLDLTRRTVDKVLGILRERI